MYRDDRDCGFRDDREVDLWYGRCPDCGQPRPCYCQRDTPEPEDMTPEDPEIPF